LEFKPSAGEVDLMREVLELLIRIQDLGDEIKKKEHELKQIPGRINKLEREIERVTSDLTQAKNRIVEIKKVYKLKELEIADNETKTGKLNQQTHTVKTNEEYRAILNEIDYLKNSNRKIEDEMIEFMEEEERLKKSVAAAEKESNETMVRKTGEITALKNRQDELAGGLDLAKQDFDDQIKKLPAEVRSIYERVSNARDRAICRISNDSICTGCYSNLTPQTLNELKKKNKVVLCDNCGRILVYGS
jgi:predicted  nucleic acid-binding Zn-ribbon protein